MKPDAPPKLSVRPAIQVFLTGEEQKVVNLASNHEEFDRIGQQISDETSAQFKINHLLELWTRRDDPSRPESQSTQKSSTI
jgi:hypothetical protein